MNNETMEDQVLGKKKSSSKKTFFIVAGLLVLGIVSLFGGIKILSKLSISADTNTPPVPPDPYSVSVTVTSSSIISVTPTASTISQPPTPPPPGTSINVTIPAGWSMIAGLTIADRDISPFNKAGMFVYSFNDPKTPDMDWIISNPTFTSPADFFNNTAAIKFWPHSALGYYVYNPGSAQTLELTSITPTRPDSTLIFGRGWHLMYSPGAAQDKDSLLKQVGLQYNDGTIEDLLTASGESDHKVSIKVYVISNQGNVSDSSIKELAGIDSTTTISKIPAKSYFWLYLRRTKSRVVDMTVGGTASNMPVISATAVPSVTAYSGTSGPPVPTVPSN